MRDFEGGKNAQGSVLCAKGSSGIDHAPKEVVHGCKFGISEAIDKRVEERGVGQDGIGVQHKPRVDLYVYVIFKIFVRDDHELGAGRHVGVGLGLSSM